jgi:hypothetical protein
MEENDLTSMVARLTEAENTVHTTRENITKHLVESNMTQYFSVDWSKLRRDQGFADKYGRMNAKRR